MPEQPTDADRRTLEFEIEVAGTPEEVWEAIATGPGISSWYVPHRVEEREGGAAVARFGPGLEMEVPGRVAAWEPPARVVFDGGPGEEGLAFEWTIEARSGGTCTVRLVNSGFDSSAEWDAMYDGMAEGWPMFLLNLKLHRSHFPGRRATAMLPTGTWPGPRDRAWRALAAAVGLGPTPKIGDAVKLDDAAGPPLAGTVVDAAANRVALLLDEPAPGTAFVAAEGGLDAETSEVSIWAYLYGDDRDDLVARDQGRWVSWLADRA